MACRVSRGSPIIGATRYHYRTRQSINMMMSASRPSPAQPATPTRAPGRPKDADKRAAILEAAKQLFVQHGYAGVSMDQIAAAAGVSKLTLYSHFGDKDNLFIAAVRTFCEQSVPDAVFQARPGQDVRAHLLQVSQVFVGMILSPEAIAGHRMLCSPQVVQSPLPAAFWAAGPQRIQAAFTELLDGYVAQGLLDIDDTPLAASQLVTLLKGELHSRELFDFCCSNRETTVEQHVQACVDVFMRAYAPR